MTARQSGSPAWLAATPLSASVTIDAGSQTIHWTSAPPSVAVDDTFPIAAAASSGLPVVITATGNCDLEGDVVNGDADGTCRVTATQPGSGAWLAATPLSAEVTVGSSTSGSPESVTASPSPAAIGESVTLTANVSAPKGKVQFFDGTTLLGTKTTSNATASLATTKLAVGSHSITIAFTATGSSTVQTSDAITEVVDAATTSVALTSSANPSWIGQSVTFKASASRVAPALGKVSGGTVSFYDDGVLLGSKALGGGSASFVTKTLSVGSHTITAVYTGSSTDTGASSNEVTQVVNAALTTMVLTSSENPSSYGQSVTLKTSVKRVAPAVGAVTTGTVDLYDGSALLAAIPIKSGTASLATKTLAAATHPLTAVYGGSTPTPRR